MPAHPTMLTTGPRLKSRSARPCMMAARLLPSASNQRATRSEKRERQLARPSKRQRPSRKRGAKRASTGKAHHLDFLLSACMRWSWGFWLGGRQKSLSNIRFWNFLALFSHPRMEDRGTHSSADQWQTSKPTSRLSVHFILGTSVLQKHSLVEVSGLCVNPFDRLTIVLIPCVADSLTNPQMQLSTCVDDLSARASHVRSCELKLRLTWPPTKRRPPREISTGSPT